LATLGSVVLDPPEHIKTQRLRMRHPRLSDAPAIFEYASDPEVTRYMDWPTHTSVQTAVDFVQGCLVRLTERTELTWALTVPPEDRTIGVISCRMHGHSVDFGYALNRDYWRRGLATEATRAIVEWVSNLEDVYRVWATCDVENVASARVLEKAGLSREGVLRCWSIKPNIGPRPRDAFVYAKVRSAA
jgi:RimJ/RimL family protein N-acetyltransferase